MATDYAASEQHFDNLAPQLSVEFAWGRTTRLVHHQSQLLQLS